MSAIEDLETDGEPIDEAGSVLIQLVAAVDYLRRGIRPGFTVWDAFEEALRWHAGIDEDWTARDPLLRTINLSFTPQGQPSASEILNLAIRRWVEASGAALNDGFPWELPARLWRK